MDVREIKSCYIGPEISPEQFIAEHFFLYLIKGKIEGYDGHKKYVLKGGQCCIVTKNRLARYNKTKENDEFRKVVIVLDEPFLRKFQQRYGYYAEAQAQRDAFLLLEQHPMIPSFIQSLTPYFQGNGKLNPLFADVKREELLLVLLAADPSLANSLFDFGIPDKIDLEAFMNKNYKFNVGIERFAYLTGRSLSAFKRDFATIFGDTPHRWLQQRRLEEAYFLIEKKGQKPSDIYQDLGFEDLSHFSFVFKKQFGKAPSTVK